MTTKNIKFTDLLDCPASLTPNDLIAVHPNGFVLTQITASSLIANIGLGVRNDIPTYTGGNPPLQDSGVAIVPLPLPNIGVALDLDPTNPLNSGLALDKTNSVLALIAGTGALPLDLDIINKSTGGKDIRIVNQDPAGAFLVDAPTSQIIEPVNGNFLRINNLGSNLNIVSGSNSMSSTTGCTISDSTNINVNSIIFDPSRNIGNVSSLTLADGLGNSVVFNRANGGTPSYPLVWPNVQGGAGTKLQNDGAGNLSWV